jgi:hypothetical protein
MEHEEMNFQSLCVDIVELVTNNLLHYTRSESESIKLLKIAIERSLSYYPGDPD